MKVVISQSLRSARLAQTVNTPRAPFLSLMTKGCTSHGCTCEDHLEQLRAALSLLSPAQALRLCAAYNVNVIPGRMDVRDAEERLVKSACVPAEVVQCLDALLAQIEQEHRLQLTPTDILEDELKEAEYPSEAVPA